MSYQYDYLLTAEATPMYEGIASHINDCNPLSILDIGCGHTRWLEHYNGSASITGVDNNTHAINYCQDNYAGNFVKGDAWNLEVEGQFDVIVLGGMLYYFKGDISVLDFVESIIEKYKPKHIVIQEPFPSISHHSPDFIPLLDKYAWSGEYYDLNIRMGQRIVITVDVDKARPERKIKSISTNNQNPFDLNILQFGVYTANTESINNSIDGEVLPPTPSINNYASVCAGFKSLYKACLDHTPNKQIKFTWFDISPTAVLYKMYQDMMRSKHPGISWNDQLEIYKRDYDSRIIELRDTTIDIDTTVESQLGELGIEKNLWDTWLIEYGTSKKKYVKCDIVNNLKYAKRHVEPNSWLWYSNVFDWHQFTFPEKSKATWINYMGKNNVHLVGKTIPTEIESHIADYIRGTTSVESYSNILHNLVNRLWYGICATDMTSNLIIKQNHYALTIRNEQYKIKVYVGYNAVLAKHNYERCKHLVTGTTRSFEHCGVRIELYEYIDGQTLDNVDSTLLTKPLQELINSICDNSIIAIYPYDISPYNMVYTKDKQIKIIDWDYCIYGTRLDLESKINKAMGLNDNTN